MDLRNCPQCGRLFQYLGKNLCPVCRQEEDKVFEQVRDYLRDHEGATADEVAEATGVDAKKIMHFLREGRILVKNGSSGLYCESCGVPIPGGRYCAKCGKSLVSELEHKLQEWGSERGPNSWGMHSQESRRVDKK